MKHIKKFENEHKFKVGDYVKATNHFDLTIGKIIYINDYNTAYIVNYKNEDPFMVFYEYLEFPTEEELEQYELESEANKYNL